MQDKTEDKPGASPEDACSHGHDDGDSLGAAEGGGEDDGDNDGRDCDRPGDGDGDGCGEGDGDGDGDGDVGYCGSCWAEQAPKCRHGHPGACGFCIAAVGRELELASARERISKLSGLHPDRKLADHLDALATRPGHEEVRRERAELRATLVEALGPLPTDHPHMLGQLRVRLADASKWEAMCDKAAELTMEARAEAKRYRDRCPVTAEDVKAVGVTAVHARAWLDAKEVEEDLAVDWYDDLTTQEIADLCVEAAEHWDGVCSMSMAILDEMAAQEAP